MTRNSPFKTTVLSVTVGMLAVLAAPSASAQEIKFAYRQYELQTPDGTRNVYKRMIKQVRNTCSQFGATALDRSMTRGACVKDLSDQLVSKIGDAQLAALHENRSDTRIASR
ncbi:UrcA family protein [Sphingomonas sp. LaA6.9]|uniref:UrcA family protein n=1 Tax=Sphingomonas sp. LaA6.9 TaxID=2919914 RepID=UPI001F4FC7F6|nr:UrcA family protein [Sphingomonas sp. LaA6.9]MCJ8158456.1 UrcA family protein [Sphingomonas sp. LaA6.9]